MPAGRPSSRAVSDLDAGGASRGNINGAYADNERGGLVGAWLAAARMSAKASPAL